MKWVVNTAVRARTAVGNICFITVLLSLFLISDLAAKPETIGQEKLVPLPNETPAGVRIAVATP